MQYVHSRSRTWSVVSILQKQFIEQAAGPVSFFLLALVISLRQGSILWAEVFPYLVLLEVCLFISLFGLMPYLSAAWNAQPQMAAPIWSQAVRLRISLALILMTATLVLPYSMMLLIAGGSWMLFRLLNTAWKLPARTEKMTNAYRALEWMACLTPILYVLVAEGSIGADSLFAIMSLAEFVRSLVYVALFHKTFSVNPWPRIDVTQLELSFPFLLRQSAVHGYIFVPFMAGALLLPAHELPSFTLLISWLLSGWTLARACWNLRVFRPYNGSREALDASAFRMLATGTGIALVWSAAGFYMCVILGLHDSPALLMIPVFLFMTGSFTLMPVLHGLGQTFSPGNLYSVFTSGTVLQALVAVASIAYGGLLILFWSITLLLYVQIVVLTLLQRKAVLAER